MLEGKTPWTGNDLIDLKQNIQTKPLIFKDNIKNTKIKNLIKSMLTLESKNRIGWSEIFENELFQKMQLEQNKISLEMSF